MQLSHGRELAGLLGISLIALVGGLAPIPTPALSPAAGIADEDPTQSAALQRVVDAVLPESGFEVVTERSPCCHPMPDFRWDGYYSTDRPRVLHVRPGLIKTAGLERARFVALHEAAHAIQHEIYGDDFAASRELEREADCVAESWGATRPPGQLCGAEEIEDARRLVAEFKQRGPDDR